MEEFIGIPIDDVRAYWNRRPCNIRHSTAPIGTREYFDQVEARKYLVESHIPVFADFARWKDKRVLEIGCGIGTDTINFARAGAKVTAVDLSSESLDLARKRAEVFGFEDRIDFHEVNAERLSEYIAPETYDLIYSFGVIHHSPHPEKIIAEIRDHFVGPDSTLKLMVYNRNSWKVLWMLLLEKGRFWDLDKIIAKHSEAQSGCPVTYSYSRSSVKGLLGDGFEVEDSFVDHIFPYQIEKYIKHEYEKEWYWQMMPDSVFRRFERLFGWHLCVTAKVARHHDI